VTPANTVGTTCCHLPSVVDDNVMNDVNYDNNEVVVFGQ